MTAEMTVYFKVGRKREEVNFMVDAMGARNFIKAFNDNINEKEHLLVLQSDSTDIALRVRQIEAIVVFKENSGLVVVPETEFKTEVIKKIVDDAVNQAMYKQCNPEEFSVRLPETITPDEARTQGIRFINIYPKGHPRYYEVTDKYLISCKNCGKKTFGRLYVDSDSCKCRECRSDVDIRDYVSADISCNNCGSTYKMHLSPDVQEVECEACGSIITAAYIEKSETINK